jgi:hypothetical protein
MDEATTSTTEAMTVDPETPASVSASAFAQQGTVTLLVGLHEEPLVAHESYLTKNSEFFQAAMKKEWVEGQTRIIKLPEDNSETVTNYLAFTYSRGLPTSKVIKSYPPPTESEWKSLAKMYVFGERVLDKCVRNAIVAEVSRLVTPDENGDRRFMPTAASNIFFDGTPEGSPVRQWIIDKHVSNGHKLWLGANDHPALVLEVARALLEKASRCQPYGEYRCRTIKADDYLV